MARTGPGLTPPLRRALIAAALFLTSAPPLAAQWSSRDSLRTPAGICHVWESIPGGSSPADSSSARCALDESPRLLSDPALPQPLVARDMGGRYTVIVNADGTVDRGLTRAWLISGDLIGDSVAERRLLETIGGWRFRPGRRAGKPVRSGFQLEVETDTRVDTLPARLRWTHHTVPLGSDSLLGRWERLPARDASLTPERSDALEAAIVRRLVATRVLRRTDRFCLVLDADADSAAHRRASRVVERVLHEADEPSDVYSRAGSVAGFGCERRPGAVRLFLPRPRLTEGDRVVVMPAGDWLPDWPPGPRGTTYAGWTGRCVALVPRDARVSVDCEITPEWQSAVGAPPSGPRDTPRWYRADDSIAVRAIATTRGAFQADTVQATVNRLPRLSTSAVRYVATDCDYTWSIHSPGTDSVRVVLGDLSERGSLWLTAAANDPPPRATGGRCVPAGSRDSTRAMFLLGDIGAVPGAPVTVCLGGPDCAGRYTLDPRTHTLAVRAAVRLRIGDLREETRTGQQAVLRVQVAPVPEGLTVLVVVRRPSHQSDSIWAARRVTLDTWEWGVLFTPVLSPDTELAVYLVGP